MSSSTQSQSHSDSSFSQLLRSIFSDNSNIMLAAIISLLLVILFVLLLHLYAKWFLAQAQAQAQAQARRRRRRRRPVTVSDVLGPSRFHHFHTFNLQPDSPVSPSKGLDSAAIAAIPVFVYEEEEDDDDGNNNNEEEDRELECVICLSAFGEGEIGRSLPKCAHAFHLECIDMWLASHSNCPICRAPIMNVSEMGSCVDFGDDSSALLEIVIDSSPTSEINISESESTSTSSSGVSDSAVSISETSSSLLLGCSLKRMLSKVFPSNVNDLNQ